MALYNLVPSQTCSVMNTGYLLAVSARTVLIISKVLINLGLEPRIINTVLMISVRCEPN